MSDYQLRSLARRLDRLEKARLRQKQPTLGFSTIDDGAITAVDADQNLTMVIGKQFDGTSTSSVVTGPTPPTPSTPTLTAGLNGIQVDWDGLFVDGAVAPMDFTRVTVYAIPTADIALFDPVLPTYAVSTFTATGGRRYLNLPADVEHSVLLVTWTEAGKFSEPSTAVSATPEALPDPSTTVTDPPASSPILTAYGVADGVVLKSETVDATTLIEYHMSETDGFTPTAGDPTTLLGIPTRSAVNFVTSQPNGDPIDLSKTYFFRAIATNILGAAAPSPQVEGKADPSAVTEAVMATVIAGYVLSGRITVGGITIDPNDGIVISLLDGGTISFPADGTDAEITAKLVAKSLNVEDRLTIGGTGKIEGEVSLANGVTAPNTEPVLARFWPSAPSDGLSILNEDSGNYTDNGNIQVGLTPHISNADEWVVAVNFFGAAMRPIKKSSWNDTSDPTSVGTTPAAVFPDPSSGKAWVDEFYPSAITTMGSHYYLIGSDGSRSGSWYIYKIDSSYDKVDEQYITSLGNFPYAPKITNDGTDLWIVFVSTSDNLMFRRHDGSTMDYVEQRAMISPSPYLQDIGDASFGSADLGSSKMFVAFRNSGKVMCWNATGALSTWTRDASHDFERANSKRVLGMEYDSGEGRFFHYDELGFFHKYSKLSTTSATVRAKSTFYDGDNSNYPAGHPLAGTPSGTHETDASPESTITAYARSWIRATAQTPPDSAETDPNLVDKANRIGLYLTTTASTFSHQIYLPVGTYTKQFDEIAEGAGAPPSTNGFETADSAPGRIFSNAETDGSPTILLKGSGDGRVGPLAWDDQGEATTDATLPIPYARRYNGSTLSIPTTTVTQVTYNTNEETTGITFTAGGTFTIIRPGVYELKTSQMWDNGTSGRRMAIIRINGSEAARKELWNPNASNVFTVDLSTNKRLAAGDTVTFHAYQTGVTNLNLSAGQAFTFCELVYKGR